MNPKDALKTTPKVIRATYNYRHDARCVIGSTWWLPKCFLMLVHKMKLIPTGKHLCGADDKTDE
jgi:hypothetical protein